MHRGTFTTKAALKRANRALEFALRDAEICDVLRTAAGGSGSADALRAIYKEVLVNQFHDILPGSHIHPVYEDAMNDYTEAALALEELQGSGKMWFNSLKFARRAPVFIPDAAGPIVRCGQTGRFTIPGLAPFASAEQLPALPAVPGWLAADGLQVQTPLYRIAFAEDGSILHLWDKTLHREWVDGVWNRLREKIEKDPSAPRHIQTVWGAGYGSGHKKAAAPAHRSRPRKSGASPGSAFFSCCCVILRGDAAGALRQKRVPLAQNAQKLSIPFYRSEIPVKKAKQISKIQIYSVCSQMV